MFDIKEFIYNLNKLIPYILMDIHMQIQHFHS